MNRFERIVARAKEEFTPKKAPEQEAGNDNSERDAVIEKLKQDRAALERQVAIGGGSPTLEDSRAFEEIDGKIAMLQQAA